MTCQSPRRHPNVEKWLDRGKVRFVLKDGISSRNTSRKKRRQERLLDHAGRVCGCRSAEDFPGNDAGRACLPRCRTVGESGLSSSANCVNGVGMGVFLILVVESY